MGAWRNTAGSRGKDTLVSGLPQQSDSDKVTSNLSRGITTQKLEKGLEINSTAEHQSSTQRIDLGQYVHIKYMTAQSVEKARKG